MVAVSSEGLPEMTVAPAISGNLQEAGRSRAQIGWSGMVGGVLPDIGVSLPNPTLSGHLTATVRNAAP